jgi:metallophosphoesterase superfamily enzyme
MSTETRIVVMGDNHGNEGDTDSLKAVLEFCKEFKPHHRVHLGDNWDLACLRKGIGKGDKESAWNVLREDMQAGKEWLEAYRPTHFLMGNHDDRVREQMEGTDSITKLEALQEVQLEMSKALRNAGTKHIRQYEVTEGYLDIGKLTFTHGFAHGKNAAEKMANAYIANHGGGIVMGHLHRHEQLNVERRGGGSSWICGCTCNLKMRYARRHLSTLKWQHGFLAILMDSKGKYIGGQAHRFNGKWRKPFITT